MKVEEMIKLLEMHTDLGWFTTGTIPAIVAKLRAAEELGIAARVACKLSTENHMPWMGQLKLMHDAYEKAGTEVKE